MVISGRTLQNFPLVSRGTFIEEHVDAPYADRFTDSKAYFHVADEAELSRVNYTECFLITAVPGWKDLSGRARGGGGCFRAIIIHDTHARAWGWRRGATALKKITCVSLRPDSRVALVRDTWTTWPIAGQRTSSQEYACTHLDHTFVGHVLDPLRHYARRRAYVDVGMAG